MFDLSGGTGTFGAAVLMLMFTFGGYELITIPASEARSPRRDAPRALLLTIGVVFVIYFLVQLVAVGTLPALDTSDTPLADAAEVFGGSAFGVLIALGGLLSIAGSNAGSMLTGPRLTFALSDNGQLPRFFAHVNGRYRTPDVSILIYLGVAVALAYSGTFVQLATLSVVARIMFYMTTCAAIPVLRRRFEAPADAFKLPGGMLIPGFALIVCIMILKSASAADIKGGGIALLIGAVFYLMAGNAGKQS